jgi:hypothetical protein
MAGSHSCARLHVGIAVASAVRRWCAAYVRHAAMIRFCRSVRITRSLRAPLLPTPSSP